MEPGAPESRIEEDLLLMPAAKTPWNIVVVVADTLRPAYIGAYGNEWIHTPNMDRLAREGTRFTRALSLIHI